MPRQKKEPTQTPVYVYDGYNHLNGEPLIDGKLPQWALDKMSERLTRRISELLAMPKFVHDREVIIRKYGHQTKKRNGA